MIRTVKTNILFGGSSKSVNLRYKWIGRFKGFILNMLAGIILIGISYIILSPIIGVIAVSVMSIDDLFNPMVYLIPENFTMDNIRYAMQYLDYWVLMSRTLVYSLGMAVLHVLVTSFVGYGFARYRFPGRGILFGLLVFTIILPVQTYMVPLFMQLRFFGVGPLEFNLIGGFSSIILLTLTGMGIRSGLFIYIYRQFFRGLPVEISEAALIDGAGPIRTFATVMLPNSKPATVTVLLFAFVWHYGDTFYSSMFMRGSRLMPASLQNLLVNFMMNTGGGGTTLSFLRSQIVFYAGIVIVIVPILVIYIILQRHFIEGLERSGIVG